jgi:thymidine kinase
MKFFFPFLFFLQKKKKSEEEMKGKIILIIGPMFAGKTFELGRQLSIRERKNNKCLVIKHTKDIRYTNKDEIIDHDNRKIKTETVSACKLYDFKKKVIDGCYNTIGIDEGQFFPDLNEFCNEMANLGKTIVVSALQSTFFSLQMKYDLFTRGWKSVLELMICCEKIIKLKAVCEDCKEEDASFSYKLDTTNNEIVQIGSKKDYIAVCRQCYNLRIKEKQGGDNGGDEDEKNITPENYNAHFSM